MWSLSIGRAREAGLQCQTLFHVSPADRLKRGFLALRPLFFAFCSSSSLLLCSNCCNWKWAPSSSGAIPVRPPKSRPDSNRPPTRFNGAGSAGHCSRLARPPATNSQHQTRLKPHAIQS